MNVGRLMLSGLLAGVIEIVLKMIAGGVYLNASFTEEIGRVNPALLANMERPSGLVGFLAIHLLLGITTMFIYAAMSPRFETRRLRVVTAAVAAWAVESLNWGLVGLIGIFSWWRIGIEATVTLGIVLVAVYMGSLVYRDAHAPGRCHTDAR